MPDQPACPLCDRTDASIGRVANRDAYWCECPVCGRFVFTWEGANYLRQRELKERRWILSSLTRRASERGERLELLTYSIDELLERTPIPRTPSDIVEPLLLWVHDHTTDPFGSVRIPLDDYPLFFVRDAAQLRQSLGLLSHLGLVELGATETSGTIDVHLTLNGWSRVAELRRAGRSGNRAFVAMSFAPELNAAYDEGIFPALNDAGWEPRRVDRTPHNDRIDDKIIAEIRRAGMVVADVTGNRQGVYFEAGFALGLGLPVIWTVRESDLHAVHFDTRQYNYVVWTDPADLRSKLHDRVVATVQPPA